MQCPFCMAQDTKVIDSRLGQEGDNIRRRRKCLDCKERFTTYEVIELNLPRLIKQDNSRQAFNENKLRDGLLKATQKCPVSIDSIDAAVARIKRRLMACGEKEVHTRVLGEWVMDELRAIDKVAYVRFASVYRNFQDLSAFREEIERLQNPHGRVEELETP